jgi:hypothetical protein
VHFSRLSNEWSRTLTATRSPRSSPLAECIGARCVLRNHQETETSGRPLGMNQPRASISRDSEGEIHRSELTCRIGASHRTSIAIVSDIS